MKKMPLRDLTSVFYLLFLFFTTLCCNPLICKNAFKDIFGFDYMMKYQDPITVVNVEDICSVTLIK